MSLLKTNMQTLGWHNSELNRSIRVSFEINNVLIVCPDVFVHVPLEDTECADVKSSDFKFRHEQPMLPDITCVKPFHESKLYDHFALCESSCVFALGFMNLYPVHTLVPLSERVVAD